MTTKSADKIIGMECTAPAPQPAETTKEWKVFSREAHEYLHVTLGVGLHYYPICADLPKHECVALVFGKTDEEALRRAESILRQHFVRVEATPQVTPCDHFWRTVAVNPRWSWFTECEKCKIGAPLELQAENYVEGTSEPASPDPFSKGYKHREGKPVSDACGEGMHAECTQDLTKCHCTFRTGHTVLHAYVNPKLASEQASPTPDKCPVCGSVRRDTRKRLYHPTEDAYCFDSWHTREVERG